MSDTDFEESYKGKRLLAAMNFQERREGSYSKSGYIPVWEGDTALTNAGSIRAWFAEKECLEPRDFKITHQNHDSEAFLQITRSTDKLLDRQARSRDRTHRNT